MRKNIITISLSMIFLLTIMLSFVNSEFYMFNEVNNIEGNITTLHGLYKLDDTSNRIDWSNFEYDIEFSYSTSNLPFNLTYGAVDWCNFSYSHYKNEFDNEGNYFNTTIVQDSYYFNSGVNSGEVTIKVKDKDVIITDMKCHYTDNRSQYEDNILVGRYSTFAPSTECRGCKDFTLEELSNELERSQEITEKELEIYEIIDTIIFLNYRLWLIASWLIKIFLLVFSVGLVFMGIYHLYKFLEDVARRI